MTAKRKPGNDGTQSIFGSRRRNNETATGGANWGGVSADTLYRLIDTVTSRGGAIRFGYTRDGGAYALGLYYGAETTTEYCRPSEDIETFLSDWIETYKELPNTGGKSPAQ